MTYAPTSYTCACADFQLGQEHTWRVVTTHGDLVVTARCQHEAKTAARARMSYKVLSAEILERNPE